MNKNVKSLEFFREWTQPSTGKTYKQVIQVQLERYLYGADADGNRGESRWEIINEKEMGNWDKINADTFTEEDESSLETPLDTDIWLQEELEKEL